MKKFGIIFCILTLLASCGSKKVEVKQEEEHHEEEQTTFVSLTDLQMKTAGIELGTVELKKPENFYQSKRNAYRSQSKQSIGYVSKQRRNKNVTDTTR